jgi:hypothetical protein
MAAHDTRRNPVPEDSPQRPATIILNNFFDDPARRALMGKRTNFIEAKEIVLYLSFLTGVLAHHFPQPKTESDSP